MPYTDVGELSGSPSQYTTGGWADEGLAVADLDRRLDACGLFQVCREVRGQYVQPRYRAEEKQPRIDRLLIPKMRLIQAGWEYGVVGIECKCSGKKLGPIVAQCLDYGRAVFKSTHSHLSASCPNGCSSGR
jgi:hypothetical protein